MRKILQLNIVVVLMLFTSIAWAQTRTVSGKVTLTDDGSSTPGVNVVLKGTTTGTTTDADGKYQLTVPNEGGTLIFSFIGLATQEVLINDRTVVDIQMVSDIRQLSEIVVTAQNIEKDRRSLGYSLKTVDGDLVSQKSDVNVLNLLQGKVAGLVITGASGGAGASTNINIRGVTSFNGSNQPLIVVDGIIFNNDVSNGAQTGVFGSQPSNRLIDISPESIETINVLKGPGASVLYGSRAASGVILITTKKGSKMAGKTEVTLTSSVNFQDVYGLPKFQNQYGQGVNNDFNNTSSNSWGPAFGGSLSKVVTIQGDTVPYQAYPNNVKNFYQRGSIIQNGVNIASGDKDKNFSMAVSSSTQKGIIPFTGFTRNSVQIGGGTKLANGLKVSTTVTYVRSTQDGTTQGNGGSALGQMTRIPRSYDLQGLPFQNAAGQSLYYTAGATNPNWSVRNEQLHSTVDRIFGNFILGYDIKPWLNVSYRATTDVYTDRRLFYLAIGSARQPTGQVDNAMIYNTELNGDLMINASKNEILPGINASILLGNNLNQRTTENTFADAISLTIPGFENVSNGSVFTGTNNNRSKRRLAGFYYDANLSYKNYLFLELAGRMDVSSTLPQAHNTFFYPAANLSFLVSDAFKIESKILSYLKVRASVAKAGKDAGTYLLNSVYVPATYGNNVASVTFPLTVGTGAIPGFAPSTRIGSNALTPEFTTTYEGGLDVGLFGNKLKLDVGYFYQSSIHQILNLSISNSSGYDTQTSNVGEITNRGLEIELGATPISKGNFRWNIAFNFSALRNNVASIAPGITSATITGSTFGGIAPSFKVGQPYGVIIGTDFATNPNGDRLINPGTGQYAPGTPNSVISTPQNKWISGLTNTFTYKRISLSTLVDVKYGAQLYSFGWVDLRSNGSLAITGAARDQPRILPGVIDNKDGTYTPNYIQVSSQTYWQGLGGLASKSAVFDATTYRLREVSLSYMLPSKVLSKTPFGSISIGVSGRNLFYYAPHAPGDPELNQQGAGNIQGLDLNGAPNARNYGFNLKITL